MNEDYKRGYRKGYYAAVAGRWPEHKPPAPPDDVVAALWRAASELRDAADGICSTLDEQDDFVKQLGPKIDAIDRLGHWIADWLKQPPECSPTTVKGESSGS